MCDIVDNNGYDDIVSATYEAWDLTSGTISGDLIYDGSDEYHASFNLDAGDWRVCVEAGDDNGAKDSLSSAFSSPSGDNNGIFPPEAEPIRATLWAAIGLMAVLIIVIPAAFIVTIMRSGGKEVNPAIVGVMLFIIVALVVGIIILSAFFGL